MSVAITTCIDQRVHAQETLSPSWNKRFVFVCKEKDGASHVRFTVRDSDGLTSQVCVRACA
jgi:hypothetical protein